MAPKRVLRQTFSDTCRKIRAEPGVSDRSKRRKIGIAKETTQHVPLERRSAKAAIKKWQPYMYPLLALTMLIRLLLSVEPRLQDDNFKGWRIYRGKKRIEQSALFDTYIKANTCTFLTAEVDKLCESMCHIHCHNVRAEFDSLHSSTIAVINAGRYLEKDSL